MRSAMCLLDSAAGTTMTFGVNWKAEPQNPPSLRIQKPRGSPTLRRLASHARIRLYRLKFRGLRVGRLAEWLAVLEDNDSSPGWRGWIEMVRLAAGATFRTRNVRAVSNYWKCKACPIMDRQLRRCGANDGLGCGCYLPYALAVGKPCWGRENVPEFPFGY